MRPSRARTWDLTMVSVTVGAILAAAMLVACRDAPDRGVVTDTAHHSAWVQVIPGTPPMCSGNPPTCSGGTAPQMIPWPERWSIEVTAMNGDSGWRDVDASQFERCAPGAVYPECVEAA